MQKVTAGKANRKGQSWFIPSAIIEQMLRIFLLFCEAAVSSHSETYPSKMLNYFKTRWKPTDRQLWKLRWRRGCRTPGPCPRPTLTCPQLRCPGRWRWWSLRCWPESSWCTSPWFETSGKCWPPHICWPRCHKRSCWDVTKRQSETCCKT